MRIKQLILENFRSITDMNINPSAINIMVGKNNSGKSSLVEAISFAFGDLDGVRLFRDRPSMLMNDFKAGSTKIEIRSDIENHSIAIKKPDIAEILLELKDQLDLVLNKFSSSEELFSHYYTGRIDQEIISYVFSKIKADGNLPMILDAVAGTNAFTALGESLTNRSIKLTHNSSTKLFMPPYNFFHEKNFIGLLTDAIADITNLNNKKNSDKVRLTIHHYLSDFFKISMSRRDSPVDEDTKEEKYFLDKSAFRRLDHNTRTNVNSNDNEDATETESLRIEEIIKRNKLLTDLERFSFRSIVFRNGDETHEIPFDLMGDGFIALVNLLRGLIADPVPSIVVIEEPERDLHPGYIEQFTKYLVQISKTLGIQFFITTHSEDFINELFRLGKLDTDISEFIKEELSIIRVSRTKNLTLSSIKKYEEASLEVNDLELDLRGI
ncbi:MAG: AAA family ATPase [Thermoplasmataceae archaeon]